MMDSTAGPDAASLVPPGPVPRSAIYFDGTSSRGHAVTLGFNGELQIRADESRLAAWPYADIRRADSPSGTLRLTCRTAPVLARLEIRDTSVATDLISRCIWLDEDLPDQRGIVRIVGWSIAAAVSIVAVIWFGVPLAADRLTPLVPQAFERRLGGILAHELGHLRHRDGTRNLIYNGGTSFLIGLLFGDVTGSSALIFASRSLVTASYSREAEHNADTFSIDVMHKLGRPTKAMGELLFRVTGNEADRGSSILANHPLTEDRLARMSSEDRPPTGPPLLTAAEWASLSAICSSSN
jgi:Peptidase family M48